MLEGRWRAFLCSTCRCAAPSPRTLMEVMRSRRKRMCSGGEAGTCPRDAVLVAALAFAVVVNDETCKISAKVNRFAVVFVNRFAVVVASALRHTPSSGCAWMKMSKKEEEEDGRGACSGRPQPSLV